MGINQINELFKVSGTRNICSLLFENKNGNLQDFFYQSNPKSAHGKLISKLETFYNQRNEIAHSINESKSSGRNDLEKDIEFFICFGEDLKDWLERRHRGKTTNP